MLLVFGQWIKHASFLNTLRTGTNKRAKLKFEIEILIEAKVMFTGIM